MRTTTHRSLGNKLTLIYSLNALDILFTFVLLKTGMFYEANRLMKQVVENAFLSIAIKLILPAALIIYILLKLQELPETSLRICNIAINIVLGVYLFIDMLHITYTGVYAFQILFLTLL